MIKMATKNNKDKKNSKAVSKEKAEKGTRTIRLEHITKIEGHAKLNVLVENNKLAKVDLDVFESARFFESLVMCRRYDDVSPLTSRICGICSPSHSITSLMATEDAFRIKVSEQTHTLRDLLLYSSVFQNHVLHLYMLALPDYLGFESAIAMASKHKDAVLRALNLKKLGNELVTVVGGREIHPFTSIIGGFSKVPEKRQVDDLLNKFKIMRKDAESTVDLFLKLKYPKLERDAQAFAFVNKDHSFYRGKINCDGNLCYSEKEYQNVFEEHVQQGSSAKFVLYKGKPFFNGALARMIINSDSLSDGAKKYVDKLNLKNPFHNNAAQAIEVLHCFDRIIEILEKPNFHDEDPVEYKVQAGRGVAYTEAPRGLLVHDYTYDNTGHLMKANIITPTAQNLKQMEEDLKIMIPPMLNKPEQVIKSQIEMLIRAYDPCFSCSAHFLDLKIKRK
jgi:coenzyme F420-reducing hydrogenase alpha subunit